jgi:hypothetical protein
MEKIRRLVKSTYMVLALLRKKLRKRIKAWMLMERKAIKFLEKIDNSKDKLEQSN